MGTSKQQVESLMPSPAAASHLPGPPGPFVSLGIGLEEMGGLGKPLALRQAFFQQAATLCLPLLSVCPTFPHSQPSC